MCFGHCATIRILPIKLSSSKRMLFKFKMLHLFLAALKKLEYDSYKVWYSENDFFFPSAELFLLPPTCTISECQLKPSAKMLIKKWYIVVKYYSSSIYKPFALPWKIAAKCKKRSSRTIWAKYWEFWGACCYLLPFLTLWKYVL